MRIIKKGQAAIEFLYTYGWAFLVVIIAIGAMSFMIDFDSYVSDTCYISEAFSCEAYALNGQQLKLKLKNVAGKSLVLQDLECTYDSISEVTNSVGTAPPITLLPGAIQDVDCTFAPDTIPQNKKSKIKFSIAYHETTKSFNTYSDGYVVATHG